MPALPPDVDVAPSLSLSPLTLVPTDSAIPNSGSGSVSESGSIFSCFIDTDTDTDADADKTLFPCPQRFSPTHSLSLSPSIPCASAFQHVSLTFSISVFQLFSISHSLPHPHTPTPTHSLSQLFSIFSLPHIPTYPPIPTNPHTHTLSFPVPTD